jgi:cell division protein FtsL
MKVLLVLTLLVAVLTSAIQVVLAQHNSRKYFVEIQDLEKQGDELNEVWGKLQLEQSTWATDDRVEKLARSKLAMIEPELESLVLIVK